MDEQNETNPSLPSEREKLTFTRKDVDSVRYQLEIERIKRRERIAALNDYVEFFVSKALGVGGLIIGGLEWLDPNLLPLVLTHPGLIAGGGLALLTGKSILALLAKAKRYLGRNYERENSTALFAANRKTLCGATSDPCWILLSKTGTGLSRWVLFCHRVSNTALEYRHKT